MDYMPLKQFKIEAISFNKIIYFRQKVKKILIENMG